MLLIGVPLESISLAAVQHDFLVALCSDSSFNVTVLTQCNIASVRAEGSSAVVEFEVSHRQSITKATSEINAHVARGGFIRAFQVFLPLFDDSPLIHHAGCGVQIGRAALLQGGTVQAI
jgi:hypothetical protein